MQVRSLLDAARGAAGQLLAAAGQFADTAGQSLHGVVLPWPTFAAGLLTGLLLGLLAMRLLTRGRRPVSRRRRFVRAVLAFVPAIIACLLWGAWFGIIAAKSLVR